MEDTSFLFAGIKFDKNKFAKDFLRFKGRKEKNDAEVNPDIVDTKTEVKVEKKNVRKRKRKGTTGGSVEGFSVFKTANEVNHTVEYDEEDEKTNEKKEFHRQQERDAKLRKAHNIHVAGQNVPPPLWSFEELSTRYGCKPYLLRNFAALGYKEPTPIQRQAIPVLLAGRECFACAPTGSGKTLAFLCPILMKLKGRKEKNDAEVNPDIVDTKTEVKVEKKNVRKRKRKGTTGGSVEGFSVFKTANEVNHTVEYDEEDEKTNEKKEFHRQQERDAKLRKAHNIHVAGQNVPPPLWSFEELSTRYGCKPYLLRNFAALGYKEPTPIQRQAIPVLLAGRECFACAPTGSGKTLAFLCPILMKLKGRKEKNDAEVNPDIVDTKTEVKVEKKNVRKRKRKGTTGGSVEGFSVFKTANEVNHTVEYDEEDEKTNEKKEFHRQQERDAKLRKAHNIHVAGQNVPPPLWSFEELSTRYGCKPYLLRNFAALGYKEPTPIQRQAIPVLLAGRECFACAPTGSGKTLAFLCPILMKLKYGLKDGVRAVVLCPTRELAAQTTRECKKLAQGKKFYIKRMTGELARSGDFSKMPCDILISTPLRLQFAIRKRKLDLSRVQFLVVDESDTLFELGFMEQVDFVVKACSNPSVVRMLFSATLPDTIEELARTLMHDAVRITVGKKNTASGSVRQKLVFAGNEEGKFLALRQLFSESLDPPVLIFVQNKARAKELYKELACTDIKVDVIHKGLPQARRESAIDDFRSGKTWVLVSTGILDRGMDFKGLNCVINYDFPDSAYEYIHRIGRTGRAGREGQAITFYTEVDVPYLRNIANVMVQSGCEVPPWIMSMPKGKAKWKKHNPKRDSISCDPDDD